MAQEETNWQYFKNYVLPVLKEKWDVTECNGFVIFRYKQTTYEYYPHSEKIIQIGIRRSDNSEWTMTNPEFIKKFCGKDKSNDKPLEYEQFLALLK